MKTSHNMLEGILGPNLEQVVKEVDELFPQVNPTPSWSANEIFFRSGQRSVVEWLVNRITKEEDVL